MGEQINMKGLVGVLSMTEDQYASTGFIVPNKVLVHASDTGVFKLGDGKKLFAELPAAITSQLTDAQRFIVESAGKAGGALLHDANGKVDMEQMPLAQAINVRIVETYADMLALEESKRVNSLVTVIDASGDESVTAGSAQYAYDDANAKWIKINESESIDVDTSNLVKLTLMTLDTFAEGTLNKHFKPADKTKLDGIEQGAQRTDLKNVEAANALTYFTIVDVETPVP